MTFKWFRLLPIVAMSIFPALSHAQSLCDPGGMEQEMELRRALPASCQQERVQASGRVSFNIINSAEKIANEAWRRESVTKYGERFSEVKYMACRRVLCVRGSISGTHRCTISGFPCAADMSEQDKATIRQVEMSQGVAAPYEASARRSGRRPQCLWLSPRRRGEPARRRGYQASAGVARCHSGRRFWV